MPESARGTQCLSVMQQLDLSDGQVVLVEAPSHVETLEVPKVPEFSAVDVLMSLPLTQAKRLAVAEFERRYLISVMERVGGSVSAGARLAGLDRTNFRRLLQRHGLHGVPSQGNMGAP